MYIYSQDQNYSLAKMYTAKPYHFFILFIYFYIFHIDTMIFVQNNPQWIILATISYVVIIRIKNITFIYILKNNLILPWANYITKHTLP